MNGRGGGVAPRALLDDLYQRHRRRLYAFFWGRTANREDALDLVQELFARAWRHIDWLAALPHERRVYWLFACARRLGIDHHRHRQVVGRTEGTSDTDPPDADERGPSHRAEQAEALRVLGRSIRGLPAPLREVLALRVLGEMTSAEIGTALGIPAGTVRYRLMQARQRLRGALEQDSAPGRGAP